MKQCTLSLRRATAGVGVLLSLKKKQCTLSLRRATHLAGAGFGPGAETVHALLAESDSKSAQNSGALLRI